MKITNNTTKLLTPLFLALILALPAHAGENGHDHEEDTHQEQQAGEHEEHGDEHGHGEEESTVRLDDKRKAMAGIRVEPLAARPLAEEIEAPGEVQLNAYATSQVTPRIEAQVVARHARLGDQVHRNQKLVTLSSAAMAEVQGNALVAYKDWQRVSKLGKQVVSEQRFLEARVAWQQARARLLAYGMTPDQVKKLVGDTRIASADGSFALLSPQDGTVIRDDFILGQMVNPGDLLFEITDESSIWVEARVNPDVMARVKPGAAARILAADHWVQGKVIQIHHAMDEITRTMAVRLAIPNPGDHLHPGQFVTTRIQTGESAPVISLPSNAVLRSPDGDWQVFVEKAPGEYEPVEVEVVRQLPGIAVIQGLPEGTPVVVEGAFFVQSELAKSGFAVHNH
ncbi:efflux RND transporter periplasmic adaptor subunit [Thiolapillus sp.]